MPSYRIQSKTQAVKKYMDDKGILDAHLDDLLDQILMDALILNYQQHDSHIHRIFKHFFRSLQNKINLIQACLVLDRPPLVPPEIVFLSNKLSKLGINEKILKEIADLKKSYPHQIDSKNIFYIKSNSPTEYLYCLALETHTEEETTSWGYILIWTKSKIALYDNKKILSRFTDFFSQRLKQLHEKKVKEHLQRPKKVPAKEIKRIIRYTLMGIRRTFRCDYSIGLVLNRTYSESAKSITSDETLNCFEVVTEFLVGQKQNETNRSKATGLWITEAEGLLSEAVRLWREDPVIGQHGVTFHQKTAGGDEYYCLETSRIVTSLQGSSDECNEGSIFYAPLVNEGILLGFVKLSYRGKITFASLERELLKEFCQFLAVRIRNSFIYSLNIDQSRFLYQIKANFEASDQIEIQDLNELGSVVKNITEMVMDITDVETIAIGYITTSKDRRKILHFSHPVGWSAAAKKKYKDIPLDVGLAGLAVRVGRDVYLAPVEGDESSGDAVPSAYINESISHFVDVRKHPHFKNNPQYRKLSDYYVKINEKKVFADYVFLIQFKKVVLGVIDVEVTQDNWDRFIGIGYLHFFKTLANTLALLFYRVRMAEEHNRVLNAIRWLSDAVYLSPQSVIKSTLAMLKSIYGVEKAKIILCDIYSDPIEIKPFGDHYDYLFLGYDDEEMHKFTQQNSRIDADNLFLNELKDHVSRRRTFFKYIPDIETFTPKVVGETFKEKCERFKNNPRFHSYIGIILGDKNKGFGVLELVSQHKNAFEDLLMDQGFVETWASQIAMAMRYAVGENSKEVVPDSKEKFPSQIIKRSNYIPFLKMKEIEKENNLVGSGESIDRLRNYIRKASKMSVGPVLIYGESGTGKELVAQAIYRSSERCNREMVEFNCANFSEQLVEDKLFGHEKGAFTGAAEASMGLFESADGGVLFLDEISTLQPEFQSKFLRVLENYRFSRLGSNKTLQVNVFVLAATNENLKALVKQGRFRHDLFYRLEAISIPTVPLRVMLKEEPDNLLQLISHFIHKDYSDYGLEGISKSCYEKLLEHSFQDNNVRELRNIIHKAVFNLDGGSIIKPNISDPFAPGFTTAPAAGVELFDPFLAKMQKYENKHFSRDDIARIIEDIQRKQMPAEERILEFINRVGAIDIQIATLFTQKGKTWTRRILKEKLRLILDAKSNLYKVRAPS